MEQGLGDQVILSVSLIGDYSRDKSFVPCLNNGISVLKLARSREA